MAKKKIKNKEFLNKAAGGASPLRQLNNRLEQVRTQTNDIKRVRPKPTI